MYDDADDFDETSPFFDEGPGRSIVEGKKYQRRLSAGGRWAVLPRRVNLRPLADSRAVSSPVTRDEVLVDWRNHNLFSSYTTLRRLQVL